MSLFFQIGIPPFQMESSGCGLRGQQAQCILVVVVFSSAFFSSHKAPKITARFYYIGDQLSVDHLQHLHETSRVTG